MRKAIRLLIRLIISPMDHRLTYVDDDQALDIHVEKLHSRLQTITPDTVMSLKGWQKLSQLKRVIDETLSRVDDEERIIHY
jgi:hypothetical protein